MSDLLPGFRVEYRGSRGFVRYVGALQDRGDDLWVGIEWDDPTRGKHDGAVDGVTYFPCAHPTGASFVRASKLGNGGRCSLLEAVFMRHAVDDDDPAAPALPDTIGGKGGRIEFVGAEQAARRQTRIQDACSVDVRSMGVCAVGNGEKLSATLPGLRLLDLGHSLLSNPADIVVLLKALHRLNTLDLSHNTFRTDRDSLDELKAAVSGVAASELRSELRVLILNNTNLTLPVIGLICAVCPALEELRLFGAGLNSTVPHGPGISNLEVGDALAQLRVLDIGDNHLAWDNILVFGKLSKLESMYASNNRILTVRFGAKEQREGSTIQLFPKLKSLSLRGNDIRDWRSISELSYLPNLASLWIGDIPLVHTNKLDNQRNPSAELAIAPRDAIIARIGTLLVLDGSTIQKDERIYAEKRYLRQCSKAVYSATVISDVLRDHPRVRELSEKYDMDLTGDRSLSASSNDRPVEVRTLRSDLVLCTLVNHGGFGQDGVALASRKIPVGTPIGKLTGLVARCFGACSASDVLRIQLLVLSGGEQREIELLDETRDLRHYGVEGGYEVRVHAYGRAVKAGQ